MIPKTQQTVIASALVSPGRLLLLTRTKPAGRFRPCRYAIMRASQHGRIEYLANPGRLFPRLVFRLTVANIRGGFRA